MDREIEELLPFYALDALTDEEKALVEAYLSEHPEARREVEQMGGAVSALPYGLPQVEPSPRTRAALMARVAVEQRANSTAQNQLSRRAGRRENLIRVFSFGFAAVAIIWAVFLNLQLLRLRSEISALNTAVAAQSNALKAINAKLAQPTPPSVITVSLKGTDVRPQAHGELIGDPASQSAVLVIAGLSQLEAGKTYQVWLIDTAGPKSAGFLVVDANGQGVLILSAESAIGSFKSLGISIEPSGGSSKPTGKIVVLSDL